MEAAPIFPCWARHERMGHNHVVGQFETFAGTSVICRVPDVPGDDEHEALPARTLVLPMDGPAFYGFEVLDEEMAKAILVASRPRIWKQRQIAPPSDIEDADEVHAPDDDDGDMPH
jgi:hypothetical protein